MHNHFRSRPERSWRIEPLVRLNTKNILKKRLILSLLVYIIKIFLKLLKLTFSYLRHIISTDFFLLFLFLRYNIPVNRIQLRLLYPSNGEGLLFKEILPDQYQEEVVNKGR